MIRIRAIFCALWFGIMPYWVYERHCHYRRGYWKHLKLNLETAMLWILFREKPSWHQFERDVNPSWRRVLLNMWRWSNKNLHTQTAKDLAAKSQSA
jgi:hypothetical protein